MESKAEWVETYHRLGSGAEIERTKWKNFRSFLDKKDRKMFDQIYDHYKLHMVGLQQCLKTCRNTRRHDVYNIRTL